MDHYSFILTFITIILGVAVARALEGLGWPLKHPARQSFYLPYLLGGGLLIFLVIQFWWGMFDAQHYRNWNFFSFAQGTITPFLFYFMADLYAPDNNEADLKAHYWRRIRPIYVVAILILINNTISDEIATHETSLLEQHLVRLVAIIFLLVMAWSRSQRVHYLGYITLYALMITFIYVSATS